MKKKLILLLISAAVLSVTLSGCENGVNAEPAEDIVATIVEPIPDPTPTPEPTPEPEPEEEVVEGCYRSELTNEWIDEALMDQRPIAAMVDNELFALNHFGVNSCDIVYEMMNSTANDRITRLMCIAKDYENIEQLGSIRSTRPTNFMIAAEYNAILIHDGGPFYNDEYYTKEYTNNLSGGFARIPNGKSLEFTEYVTPGEYTNSKGKTFDGLVKRIEDAGYSRTYTELYEGPHFTFSNKEFLLSENNETTAAKSISLPFYHNKSNLSYNETSKEYEYYEYGDPHVDELTGETTSFKNVIIYGVSFAQLDENGYLIYNVIGSGDHGYYITNGEAIPIMWIKEGEAGITKFYNKNTGEEITLNTGKTYIAIVPDDTWEEVLVN